MTRRDFLGVCGSATSLLLPAPFFGANAGLLGQESARQAASAAPLFPHYRILPRYPSRSPLEELIQKARKKEDDFPSERYAHEIEADFARWGSELRENPKGVSALATFLSPRLEAASPRPQAFHEISPLGEQPEVSRVSFPSDASLDRSAFLAEFPPSFVNTSEVLVAEFKVADLKIASTSPLCLTTSVRYAFVGTGPRVHRLQRTGKWQIEWEQDGKLLATKWLPVLEIQSRSGQPVFVDITSSALKDVSSYGPQMLPGSDYWRTVLDAATGIDIYGNNGIAAGDYDNDGFDDLYICQPSGLPNRLYHNRGDGTFEDVTESAGVGVLDNTPCALFADVKNSGHQDLLVVTGNGPLLFLNQGDGKFELKPGAFRFAQTPQGTFTGAAFADYDRDGRLDIYFCLYSYYKGLEQYHFPIPYYDARNGPPKFLFHNEGNATFRDVTAETGLDKNNDRFSFDCTWCDFDNDGWPDLYVVNDFGRKNLYRNNRNGTFVDIAGEAGVVDIGPGMSSCWFDYDRDLNFDLYVSDMWEASGMRLTSQPSFLENMPADIRPLFRHHAKGNSLYRNLGNGRFEDRSAAAGIEKAGWSWSCYAWDFLHDGRSHLYVANGMISGPDHHDLESFFWQQVVSKSPVDSQGSPAYERGWNAINELIRSDGTWAGYQRNVFFYNNGDAAFSDVSGAVGLDFADDSRAFALADFDHDGRLEIALKNRTGPQLRILRCEAANLGNALAFRLRGSKSNRDAVGAVIVIETPEGRQMKMIQAGTGFPSQHSKEVFFGIGRAVSAHATVRWPSGGAQEFRDLPANHRVVIEEGSEKFQAMAFRAYEPLTGFPAPPAAVPPPDSCETWLIDPIEAPDFTLQDLGGQSHQLSSLRGNEVVLNFWATWSPPSVETLKALDRSPASRAVANTPSEIVGKAEGQPNPLLILAVNLDQPEDNEKVRAAARANSLRLPVLLGTDEVTGIYNLVYHFMFDRRRNLGLPTTFLIDAKGYIVKVYQGPVGAGRLNADCARIPRTPQDRARLALPFPGTLYLGRFQRNAFTYGAAFSQAGYFDQAIREFTLGLKTDPDYAAAHYNLGTLYLRQGKSEEARRHLQRALDLQPNYPDALNNLGLLAAQAGDTQEAVSDFQRAIQQDPSDAIAFENLGNLYLRLGRRQDAETMLTRAVEVAPDDAQAAYSLGMFYAEGNDFARAQQFLERAVEFQPNFPQALNNLGVVLVRSGNTSEAERVFKQCVRVAPEFDQGSLNLARLYAALDRKTDARAVLEQFLQRQPNNAEVQAALKKLNP